MDGVKSGASWAWNKKGDILDVAKTVLPLVGLGSKARKPTLKYKGRGFVISDSDEEDSVEYIGSSVIPKKAMLKYI